MSLSAFTGFWTLLDSLNCFGAHLHFLVFLVSLELFLWSSACVDLFGRLASVVPACLFVICWTSVC